MMKSEQTAVVTGAARGIGAAIATQFAREGYRTVVVDCDTAAAEQTAQDLRAEGHDAVAETLDVRRRADVDALFDRLGETHVLVNNAAVASDMVKFTALSSDRLRELIAVNVLGVFHVA